jgi:hypothetical protein
MKTVKIFRNVLGVLALALVLSVTPFIQVKAEAFDRNRIIDDALFNKFDALSAGQIDAFLNTFPNSCISPNSGFRALNPTGYTPQGGYQYSGYTTAGQVIASSAQAYGINPQVLLATLQKEQSLVAGGINFCETASKNKYAAAMGYGCPDSGGGYSYTGVDLYQRNGVTVSVVPSTCVNSAAKAGFSQQVIRGAWLLKFGQQRSLGNISWAVINGSWVNTDDPQSCYGGPMTRGTWKRCPSGSAAYYDGYTTIDGVATQMQTGATAALYWYTPHLHGNQNFFNLFSNWFGSPTSACATTGNVPGATSGAQIIPYKLSDSAPASLTFALQNQTGTGCAEAHVWAPGFSSWSSNIATGMRSSNPEGTMLVTSSPYKGARSEINYITFNGGGNRVEVHKFSPNLQKFPGYYDVATNLTGTNASIGTFVAGDFLGQGSDQMAYIIYSGTGGRVEVHLFDKTLTKAVGYYDVLTNLSNVTATSGKFVAGDFLGRGTDQLAYVLYAGNNNRAEVHLFDQSLTMGVGYYDVATNLAGITANSGTFVAGDFVGRGYDQMAFVSYSGSTNRAEFHMFDPSLTRATGVMDVATNLAGFDPTL